MKKIAYFFACVGIFILGSCSSKPKGCERFRTGHFQYHSENTGMTVNIDRNDSIQTEVTETGATVGARINWTGDCEYELTYLDKSEADTIVNPSKPVVMVNKIIWTSDNYYIFESRTKGAVSTTVADTIFLAK